MVSSRGILGNDVGAFFVKLGKSHLVFERRHLKRALNRLARCDFRHQLQLAALDVFSDAVAEVGAGKTALRA